MTVLYGSAKGLTGARSLELFEPGSQQLDAAFGSALSAADLDGDGRSDLAVTAEGAFAVFRSGSAGLSQSRSSLLHGEADGAGTDDRFGEAVAVGDPDQDGRPDLVVGSAATRDAGFGEVLGR